MKRTFALILVLLMAISVGACGTQQPEESMPPDYCDEDFLNDLKAGLIARWDFTEDTNNSELPENEYRTTCVRFEFDRLEQYKTGLFKDSKLQERALSYINLLNDQLDALNLFSADYEKYRALWSETYDKRTQLITALINDYNIEFPEKYSEIVSNMLYNSKTVTENNEMQEKIQKMVDSLNFELIENDYGFKTYRAIIENITEKTITDFALDVSLINNDDIIVETTGAYAQNLEPGQKAYIEFSSSADFSTYKVKLAYYDVLPD